MSTIPPAARVDAEDDVIYIQGHGSCVALTFEEARAICDAIIAHLTTRDDAAGDASSQKPDRDPQVDHLLTRERVVNEVSDRLMPYVCVAEAPEVLR